MASYVSKYYGKMKRPLYGIVFPIIIVGVFCGLIYLEHHLSCTILVFCIGASIMFAGGTNWKLFALGAGIMAAVVAVVIIYPDVLMNYAGERIEAWLDKSYDPLGARWQTNNSLYAIGSGGIFGVGLGNSKQKYLYVSEPQNDFIFAIVCEELGLVGAVVIIALFALLFIRGIKIAMRCQDRFGTFIVIGTVTQISVQTIFNIMVVSDTIPNTGIALPFFSYGGTAILMLLFEIGVVLSISRKSNQKKV
jgi:cell division protein FtsW